MKKRIFALFLVLMVTIGLSACGSTETESEQQATQENTEPSDTSTDTSGILKNTENLTISGDKTYTLEIAGNYSTSSFGSECIGVLEDTLESWSDGKIQVEYYPAGQLGSDREIFEAVQLGNIAMGFMTTAPQSSFVPAVAVFDMGASATNYDAAVATMSEGEFRNRMNEEYQKAGVELMAMFPTAYRELASSKEIRKFEDINGLKIRVMENPNQIEFWKDMGANPTPLPTAEVYISLQQKLVEANENPMNSLLSEKTYEQTQYIIETHHILFNNTITMNQAMWNEMPADYQAMIKGAMDATAEWGAANGLKNTEEAKAKLKEAGREIITFSQEDLDKMKAAAEPCYTMVREKVGDDLVDLWLNELDKNS